MVTKERYHWLDCSKPHCPEKDSYYVSELEKLYPQFKIELDDWYKKNGGAICDKHWEELKADKQKRYKNEQSNRNNQHKTSHCHTCNSKSLFFHFIYDKRTGKVWDSWSNASDPNNQLVFCNQSCFEKYMEKQNAYICSECGKRGSGNYIYSKTDPQKRKFCSKEHWRDYTKRKLNKTHQQEADELNQEIDDLHKQQLENLVKLMESGADLDFDFENADWLNEKQKAICRKYQQNHEEVKRLKKQQNQSNSESDLSSRDTNNSSEQDEREKTCAKCGQRGTKYNIPDKNDGKEFCSKTCCANYYYQKNNNNSSSNEPDKPAEIPSHKNDNDNSDNNENKNSPSPNKDKKNIKKSVDSKIFEDLKRKIKNNEASADEIINEYELSSYILSYNPYKLRHIYDRLMV